MLTWSPSASLIFADRMQHATRAGVEGPRAPDSGEQLIALMARDNVMTLLRILELNDMSGSHSSPAKQRDDGRALAHIEDRMASYAACVVPASYPGLSAPRSPEITRCQIWLHAVLLTVGMRPEDAGIGYAEVLAYAAPSLFLVLVRDRVCARLHPVPEALRTGGDRSSTHGRMGAGAVARPTGRDVGAS